MIKKFNPYYSLAKLLRSDYLLQVFIKKMTWGNEPYYAINKDGTRTKVFINYFPSNQELLNDGGESVSKIKLRIQKTFGDKTIAETMGRLQKIQDWAKGTRAKLSRIGNDRLVEVLDEKRNFSHIPLKYLSINKA